MNAKSASIVVDMRHARCGSCKNALQDELQKECRICGCTFDRIASNHVGLADKLRQKREAAGIVLPD